MDPSLGIHGGSMDPPLSPTYTHFVYKVLIPYTQIGYNLYPFCV